MKWRGAQELKERISLLEYLAWHDWKPQRMQRNGRGAVGLCPLHTETQPSFVVNVEKNLFYCHGCGRGGDLIRLVELWHGWRFSQAVAHLHQQTGVGAVLSHTVEFYQGQLRQSPEALAYLASRGLHSRAVIERMRIGYAPGRCLRAWLGSLGYPADYLRDTGLLTPVGTDSFCHRVVFPLEGNLYGRSIRQAAPHRFLPQSKGGLYDWPRLREEREVILVEGLLDVAALWQAGFYQTTCCLGTHPNSQQWDQLCECGGRNIYLAFDGDASGKRAAGELALRLADRGVRALLVDWPDGHDPNSWLHSGATAADVRQRLEQAR
jgi:DNA primase